MEIQQDVMSLVSLSPHLSTLVIQMFAHNDVNLLKKHYPHM